MRARTRPGLALQTLAVLLLPLLAACTAGARVSPTPIATVTNRVANPYPMLSTLKADPAAALALPGADELDRGGRESQQTLRGPQPPDFGLIFGTQADADAVQAYYDRELRALGYVPIPGAVPGAVDLAAWLWCGPQATLRLAIKEPDRAYQPSLYRGNTYRTVFNPVLSGKSVGTTCTVRRAGS